MGQDFSWVVQAVLPLMKARAPHRLACCPLTAVCCYQGVTLGGVLPAVDAEAQRSIKRHPTLQDDVIVGSGAQILGDIVVHAGVRVGGNSVVTKDVQAGATVVGVPARQMTKTKVASEPATNFSPYAMPDDRESDPRERTIEALVDEVKSQRARISALEDQLADAAVSSTAAKSAAKATPRRDKSPR